MTDAKSPAKKQSTRRGAKAEAAKPDEAQSVKVTETAAEAPQPDSQAGSVNEQTDSTAEKVETPEPDKAEQETVEMPESNDETASNEDDEPEVDDGDDELPVLSLKGITVLVKAKKQQGFWRCGRFWPFNGCEVVAVEDPEDVPAELRGHESYITPAELERLKAEPMLSVIEKTLHVEDKEG